MVQGPRSALSGKRPKGPGWGLVQWSLVQRPSSIPYGPRPSLQGQGSKARGTRSTVQDPTFEVRAAIQAARTDVHGPSTMPTGAWVNSKGQGSELKAPVPSLLRHRDQDAAPWPTVQSPATVGELGLGLATFAAQYNNAWPRQRHGHKTPNQIRAEQRRLAINVATGLNMTAKPALRDVS